MAPIRFTVLTRDDGAPVGKRVGLKDGKITTFSSKGEHPPRTRCASAQMPRRSWKL